MAKSKQAKRPRKLGAAKARRPLFNPTVRLVDREIHLTDIDWRPSAQLSAAIEAAHGLISVGNLISRIAFGTTEEARRVFEGAFNMDAAWEAFAESVPDATRWVDPVGMGALAEAVVRGAK